MNVEELITRLREDYLDDTLGVDNDDALVSDGSLIRFADEAQIQACRREDLIYDDTTASTCEITLVDGTKTYAFSPLITKLISVFHNGLELIKTNEQLLDRNVGGWRTADNGTPTHYYVKGRNIYLYPIPDATAAAYTLDLSINRLPVNQITNYSDTLEVFDEAQDDLIYWMLYRVYNKRDEDIFDPVKAEYFKSLFEQTYGTEVPLDIRIHQLESIDSLRHITTDKYQFTNSSSLGDDDFDNTGWS